MFINIENKISISYSYYYPVLSRYFSSMDEAVVNERAIDVEENVSSHRNSIRLDVNHLSAHQIADHQNGRVVLTSNQHGETSDFADIGFLTKEKESDHGRYNVRSLSLFNQEGGNVYHISRNKKAGAYASDDASSANANGKEPIKFCIPWINTRLKLGIFISVVVLFVMILIVGLILVFLFAIGEFNIIDYSKSFIFQILTLYFKNFKFHAICSNAV
jgi:hypothetical protein